MKKRRNGVYYTMGNPFDNPAFRRWNSDSGMEKKRVLEPFAGSNSLIKRLKVKADSFDIEPSAKEVMRRDTLADFPSSYSVCITNPPWLAKNRATRLGIPFPCDYDDLYKFALKKCLDHCEWIAAIIPESFIRSGLFQERLSDFVSLPYRMFADTDHPAGLALFGPDEIGDVTIWCGDEQVGILSELEKQKPPASNGDVRFNVPNGNVGLIAIDNTKEPSIRFCDPEELGDYEVKATCRSITKLLCDGMKLAEWNDWLTSFRENTGDVFLTSFKGMRKDGKYRRRLDFGLARDIVCHVK